MAWYSGAHQRPYKGKDRSEIKEALKTSQIVLSHDDVPFQVSEDYIDLVNRLILKNPDQRLGAGGAAEIKAHPFFDNFDWEALENMAIIPPYKPKATCR